MGKGTTMQNGKKNSLLTLKSAAIVNLQHLYQNRRATNSPIGKPSV